MLLHYVFCRCRLSDHLFSDYSHPDQNNNPLYVKFDLNYMLIGPFSKVLGIMESISGVQKAKGKNLFKTLKNNVDIFGITTVGKKT